MFYWMNRFQDLALFQEDPLHSTTGTILWLPWEGLPLYVPSPGYGLLFYMASFLADPALFGKLLCFFSLPVAVLSLYEFGAAARVQRAGTVLAIGYVMLNLASPSSVSVLAGLRRSLASPLLVLLMCFLHRQQRRGAVFALFLGASIYALVFMLGVVTWALVAVRVEPRPHMRLPVSRQQLAALLIAVLLGGLVLSPAVAARVQASLARERPMENTRQTTEETPQSREHMWNSPYYGAGGRYALFSLFPCIGRAGLANNGMDAVHLLILLCVGGLLYLVRRRRALSLSRALRCVLWASPIMFVLSWVGIPLTSSFLLYMPSRYTRRGLVTFLAAYVLRNVPDGIGEAATVFRRRPTILNGLVIGAELLAIGLVSFLPRARTEVYGVDLKWALAAAALAGGVLV